MIMCHLGPQLGVWIMQVSTFSSVLINRFHCIPTNCASPMSTYVMSTYLESSLLIAMYSVMCLCMVHAT